MKLILNAFWHRFWDDFLRFGNVKNEQKRGSVALFLIFGVCHISCRFGPVLGGSGLWGRVFGAFWAILAGFSGFEKESNFEAEVGSRKSGSRDAKGGLTGRWPEDLAALKTIVDQSIIDNIDRRSLTSLIVGY